MIALAGITISFYLALKEKAYKDPFYPVRE